MRGQENAKRRGSLARSAFWAALSSRPFGTCCSRNGSLAIASSSRYVEPVTTQRPYKRSNGGANASCTGHVGLLRDPRIRLRCTATTPASPDNRAHRPGFVLPRRSRNLPRFVHSQLDHSLRARGPYRPHILDLGHHSNRPYRRLRMGILHSTTRKATARRSSRFRRSRTRVARGTIRGKEERRFRFRG